MRDLFKVGHTGDLRERLHDSAYITCFPPDSWQYSATIEVTTKTDAYAIETGVLQCLKLKRLGRSELVVATLEEIISIARQVALAMKIAGSLMLNPTYERTRCISVVDKTPSELRVQSLIALAISTIEKLTLPAQAPPAQAPPELTFNPIDDAAAPVDDQELLTVLEDTVLYRRPADPLQLREYQQTAATAVANELTASQRTILQMACRCGKTLVAYEAARQINLEDRPVLFLVPGLALLRQTAEKLYQYAQGDIDMLLVGSDPRPVELGRATPMTTDTASIYTFLTAFADKTRPRWVICTYQSSSLVQDRVDLFSLIIYDEAHRICGGRAPRPFNSVLLACERSQASKQLFMSATPAYDPITPDTISMRDRSLFGGVASRYYLRSGIDAGYVNNFRLQLVAAPTGAASEDEAMAGAIAEAMRHVEKLLVFCRDIAHADRLAAATARIAAAAIGAANFECSSVHSRLPAGAAQAALQRFAAPGVRAALFNCRMLQEGVEVPPLNAVFFAAPRHSPRDIIQSICRPLNPVPGKPCSVVFLPVAYDAAAGVDAPANLRRYSTILPIVDALLEEDSRLFDMLIGGAPDDDMLQLLVVRAGGATLAAPAALVAEAAQILAACRRVIRHGVAGAAATGRRSERLLRADAIPWGRAFAELRRVVLECRRYPKTTDEWIFAGAPGSEVRVNLHAVYAAIAARYSAGTLEPYQRTDLESLPSWLPWGAEGPYAWGPCVSFLEHWLETYGIDALALEINKGGYVGLEATPMERLSGALTCVNQQVFGKKTRDAAGEMVVRAADRVPAAHAADLDRICARFGMRWRKEFRADGTVDPARPTFIQEAYGRFKQMFAEGGSAHPYIQEHFPGYPLKHARQCALDLRTEEALAALPPRRARGARTAAAQPPRAPKK